MIYSVVLNVVALLRYHHFIDLSTVAPLREAQRVAGSTKLVIIERLQAAGTYANPNDLARLIVIGITICLYLFLRKITIVSRIWLAAVALILAYAMQLTYSR